MITHLKEPEFQGKVHNPSTHIHYSKLRDFNLIHLIKLCKLISLFAGHSDVAAPEL